MPRSSSASVDPRSGSSALPPGQRIGGHYRVLDPLGRAGGFGRTYRALDETLHREVAIKEYFPRELVARSGADLRLRPHSTAESSPFEFGKLRFLEEGRTLARLDHRHVVRVLELFEELATAYLVMEYHHGSTLAEVATSSGGRLTEAEVVALARGALAGLAAVHAAGVVHCDVKPSNLYLTEEGTVLLLDFGAARRDLGERTATLDGVVSPGFAPFELFQERGRIGPWTDVYGVAATAVALLTGERPPSAADRLEHDPLGDSGALAARLPERTRAALVAALAVRPEARTATADALSAALSGVAEVPRAALAELASRAIASRSDGADSATGSSTTTLGPELPVGAGRAGRRRWLAGGILLGAVALGVVVARWRPDGRLDPGRDEAAARESAPAATPAAEPERVVPEAPPLRGEALLDVRPHGELAAVRSVSGLPLTGDLPTSLPARLRLPAGDWIAVVRFAATGESAELRFTVAAESSTRVEHRFRAPSARSYFEATGW